MSDNLDAVGAQSVPSQEEDPVNLPLDTGEEQAEVSSTLPPTADADAEKSAPQVSSEALTEPSAAEEEAIVQDEPVAEEGTVETMEPEAESMQKTGMTDVFSDDYTYMQAKRGEIREAQIITIRDDGVMVDLGLKREGLVPAYDLQRVGQEAVNELSVGDEIHVYIVRPEDKEGNIVVSWYRARQEQDWLDAQRLHEADEIWEGKVKGYNRGGLIVPFGKIRGFVPASHVTGISRRMDHDSLQARLAEMVGQTLPLRVLEVNRQSRRLIFSERIARREWRAKKREQLLSELREGDTVHGVVSNICDFGVFVDIGGTDGLVHISELSWRRTNHPKDLVKVGEEVDAYVLRVDRDRKRIGLSLRMLELDPWESAEANYHVGQLVTGVVTKLTDFGAFAALDDGIEGLIHITELAEVAPRHPSEVIARGAELPLLVVKVDSRRRRMGLSLKRVSEEEWYQWEEERRAQAEEQAEAEEAPAPEEAPPEPAEHLAEAEVETVLAVETAEPAEAAAADDEEPQEEAIVELAPSEESETPAEAPEEQPEEETLSELASSEESETPAEAADEQPADDAVAELALSEEAETPAEAPEEQPEEEALSELASSEESETLTETIDQPAATVPDEEAEASE